jgi:hypothetical protein
MPGASAEESGSRASCAASVPGVTSVVASRAPAPPPSRAPASPGEPDSPDADESALVPPSSAVEKSSVLGPEAHPATQRMRRRASDHQRTT